MRDAEYFVAKARCHKLGMNFDPYHLNKVSYYPRAESLKHFVAKCIVYSILRNYGRLVFTEYPLNEQVRIDVFDLDYQYAYELETNPKRFKETKMQILMEDPRVKEIIIIDLHKIPNDIEQMHLKLKEYVV